MNEQAMILSAKTWNDCADQERGIKPNRMIAAYAALIEQQAARIAELEGEVARARSLSDTEIELLRRAEAAEAEVKRLREVLNGIDIYLSDTLSGRIIPDPATYKDWLIDGIREARNRARLSTREPRHD